jgi:DNA primase|nr:CHC2 zinc finger domain-containing protein [uncultured Mucilaginibacter sp.]
MNLVEIASKHILLQQSRKALKGRCPFHPDETTSLMIIAQSNYFKCMGCGAEGGPVEFLMLIDGKSRKEVVSQLANQEFAV